MRLSGKCKVCGKDFYEEVELLPGFDMKEIIESSWNPTKCNECLKKEIKKK